MEFVLADGTVIRRTISEALLELPGHGESEDENLLGIITLEIFGLVLDPFRKVETGEGFNEGYALKNH